MACVLVAGVVYGLGEQDMGRNMVCGSVAVVIGWVMVKISMMASSMASGLMLLSPEISQNLRF